jgi:hypothetical protein
MLATAAPEQSFTGGPVAASGNASYSFLNGRLGNLSVLDDNRARTFVDGNGNALLQQLFAGYCRLPGLVLAVKAGDLIFRFGI